MTLVALLMRSLPLTTEMDDTFGLEDKKHTEPDAAAV